MKNLKTGITLIVLGNVLYVSKDFLTVSCQVLSEILPRAFYWVSELDLT